MDTLYLTHDRSKLGVSLSTYFPKGTRYFYGYPTGEDSGFLNQVPPDVEELVAERALCYAGDHVSVVSFSSTVAPTISRALINKLDLPQIDSDRMIVLPKEINRSVRGAKRNQAIKASLLNSVDAQSLIMAQPFTSPDVSGLYQIPPALTTWLNDKRNMDKIIDKRFVPKRLATFANGSLFAAKHRSIKTPCVIKASSSSAGDGVFLCTKPADIDRAVDSLKGIGGTVIIEQYIEAVANYGVHFGIPYDQNAPADFLGINEQLTTKEGAFIGGIIRAKRFPTELEFLESYLVETVLPKVRELGWYGVGCFDVLTDASGQAYFIDSNFRMTGMSAYHFLVANSAITTPLLAFNGTFKGSQSELEAAFMPIAGKGSDSRTVRLIALSRHADTWSFNGALFFDDSAQLKDRVESIRSLGVKSEALELLNNQ